MPSIFSIGQSALAAAQVGLTVTGHNIANAATPGYSRQSVQQSTTIPQGFGFGFLGQGTEVDTVKRIYSDFIGGQINTAQSSRSALDTYYTQISQIDNILADPAAGLSPALQDFFGTIQNLTTYPDSVAARQSTLSEAQALAARFRSLGQQMQDSRDGVNSQIASSVSAINSYAEQIANLNNTISKSLGVGGGNPPNDLLDQRDQLLVDLAKEVKTVTVKQDGTSLNVFIGNGQALVVGAERFTLKAVPSPSNARDLVVGYENNGVTTFLGESALSGGKLGGLLEFRSQTLDAVQNTIGRTAVSLALSFNAQHRAGVDLDGNPGTDFFAIDSPAVIAHRDNASSANLVAAFDPANVSALTTSDYRVDYDGTNYRITRLSDGTSSAPSPVPPAMDGITFSLQSGSPAPAAGDRFLIKPTTYAALSMNVAIGNPNAIAAASVDVPLRSAIGSGNTGTATISMPVADSSYAAAPLTAPVTLSYSATGPTLTGFPSSASVTVTGTGGTTTYNPGDPVSYEDGATYSFSGLSFTLSGAPADTDSFVISPNNSDGDNRNALLLTSLQTRKILNNGTADFQNSYSQLVSTVGNKTREVEVNRAATSRELAAAVARQQSESGVNLDEEAANLLRYQQAYQAAGKVMQTASKVFDVILELGR